MVRALSGGLAAGAEDAAMPGDGRKQDDPLSSLETRIAALREARKPKTSRAQGEFNAAALAWRMVLELVTGVFVGGGIGWGIDALLGTLPVFMVVIGLLGFAAGVRTMLRTASEHRGDGAPREGARAGEESEAERG